jgi:hypothetical protein
MVWVVEARNRGAGLRPMIDIGSSRVFDCNGVTLKIARDGDGEDGLFFRHPALNHVVIIKHSTLPHERRSRQDPPVGTKLFFPFNEANPYEGGSTIFLHDRQLEMALHEKCGVNRLADKEAFEEDLRILRLLARLPTLDPFLLRDVLEAEQITVNDRYLEISAAQWTEIQGLIQQRFVPIVKAAFPDSAGSRSKAKKLIEKLWEAKDQDALQPIIQTFGLPEDGALEILYAWKVIAFYSFQFQRMKGTLLELARWLKDSEAMAGFGIPTQRTIAVQLHHWVRQELRTQWGKIEAILADYEDGYDKMFIKKTETGPFLAFLRNARATFWEIGDALGKVDQAVYCWDRITARYPLRRVHPVEMLESTFSVLAEILGSDMESETIAVKS